VNLADTLPAALASAEPAQPRLTYYDDGADERTELSGATLGNWVAKTANLIVDDAGLGTGDRATVGLPPHWQTAAVLIACWSAGLAVHLGPAPADVAFVHADAAGEQWQAADRYALNLHPLALPLRNPPGGFLDFNTEVRAHGDFFTPVTPPAPDDAALHEPGRTWTHRELLAAARDRAAELGIHGGRVLVDADALADPRDWLLAPLVAGASVVLCRNLNPARVQRRIGTERVTLVLP